MEDACGSPGRIPKICSTIQCCDDRLNPPLAIVTLRPWQLDADAQEHCSRYHVNGFRIAVRKHRRNYHR